MPNTKQIIFLKGQLRDDIKSFWQDENTGQYAVTFNKGENRLYYNPLSVDIATFHHSLEPPFRIIRANDGEVFNKVLGVNYFEGNNHSAFRIIYENGIARNYPAEYLLVEEHIDNNKSLNVFEYLQQVAQYNVLPVDEDNSISLADKYLKVGFVAKESLMEAYLRPQSYLNKTSCNSAPIFPFGCNRSQYLAVRRALENDLSIIQGPPGTGKTQTILNIAANLLLQDKSMQIVSNNNSAVSNVYEKLSSIGIDFIAAQLGNFKNKKSFIDCQSGTFPEFLKDWKLENADEKLKDAVRLSQDLQVLYESEEKLAQTVQEFSETKHQLSLLEGTTVEGKNLNKKIILSLLQRCERDFEQKGHLRIFTRHSLRRHKLPRNKTVLSILEYNYYKSKLNNLKTEKSELEQKLELLPSKSEQLRSLSIALLKGKLYEKYYIPDLESELTRRKFAIEDIKYNSREFIKEYPIVLSTTFSATSNLHPDYKFDYLIMDEASQVDISAGALALCSARKAVIVGDLKQLPNVIDGRIEEISNAVFSKYEIDDSYRFSTNSFLSSICKLHPEVPSTLLREHYRCDALIIGFCNKHFYDGGLIPMKPGNVEFPAVHLIRTVKGNHARGAENLRQVETIIQDVLPVLSEQYSDIGIIAPYNAQVEALNNALVANGYTEIKAATVHKFQGREKDAIILSTVDNQIREFTDNPHLLNVAVSRAKSSFFLVVSGEDQPDSNIKDLIDYIELYQGNTIQSNVRSIYDLLYKDYTAERLAFLRSHKKVSEYDSENITYGVILDIINEAGLNHVRVLLHYPLRLLISSQAKLTKEQSDYASRSWTHIDFLIYNTVSKKAVLAVEVDGTNYHKAGTAQAYRDSLKDSIFESIKLPNLRLATNGANEKEQIARMLGV